MCLRGEKLPSAARTWASLGAFESRSLSHSGAGFHQGFCPWTDSSCRAETLSGKALKKARSSNTSLVPPHELPLSGTFYGPTLLFLVESAVLNERGTGESSLCHLFRRGMHSALCSLGPVGDSIRG